MNKLFFIIIFSISFTFSQNEGPFKDKKTALKYLENELHNNGFYAVLKFGNENYYIKKHKNRFQIKSDKIDINSNGKTILSAKKKYEELEIYSLTQKEQKGFFFTSKILKEFDIKDIIEQGKRFKILGEVKKFKLKIEIIINKSNLIEELRINAIPQEFKIYKEEKEFFLENYGKEAWKKNNVNVTYLDSLHKELINNYKKQYWEIIDFR